MKPIDLTTAISRLLSSSELRSDFRSDPSAVAEALGIPTSNRAAFTSIDGESLERQARSLIGKRLHEVSALLPITVRNLAGDARKVFRKYAVTFWPEGHRRHAVDAVRFCGYLLEQNIKGVNRAEMRWWRFVISDRRFQIGFAPDFHANGRARRAVIIRYRRADGAPRYFALYGPW